MAGPIALAERIIRPVPLLLFGHGDDVAVVLTRTGEAPIVADFAEEDTIGGYVVISLSLAHRLRQTDSVRFNVPPYDGRLIAIAVGDFAGKRPFALLCSPYNVGLLPIPVGCV